MNTAQHLFTYIALILAAMAPHATLAILPMGGGFPINPIDPDIEIPGPEYSHMAHLHSGNAPMIQPNNYPSDPSHLLGQPPYQIDYAGDPIEPDGIISNPINFQNNPMSMRGLPSNHMNYHFNPLGDKTHALMNRPRNPMALSGMPNQMPMGMPNQMSMGMPNQMSMGMAIQMPMGMANQMSMGMANQMPIVRPSGPTDPNQMKRLEFLKILKKKATGARSNSNSLTRISSTLQDIGKLMGRNDQTWMTAVRAYFRKMLAQKKLVQKQQLLRQQKILQQRQIRQQQTRQQQIHRRRILLDQS